MKVINKQAGPSPGGAQPKGRFITVMKLDDLAAMPVPNAKGVLREGLFQMNQGTEPLSLYNTQSFQNLGFETDGDEDAANVPKTFTVRYPGDTLEIREFVQENQDVDVIVMFGGCNKARKTVIGTECSPMKMRANLVSDNETTHYELTFSNMNNDSNVPGFYDGPEPVAEFYEASTVALELLQANGPLVKMPSSETGESISVADIDHDHGSFISLVGGGGLDPAVVEEGTATGATFILKDGTSFIGLEGARLTLEVFVAGSTTYLIERSRA